MLLAPCFMNSREAHDINFAEQNTEKKNSFCDLTWEQNNNDPLIYIAELSFNNKYINTLHSTRFMLEVL
jgi:hypothetical protein